MTTTKLQEPDFKSSYKLNDYGDIFFSCVTAYKPKNIIELGTLHGYSAFHISRGIKYNGEGHLDCYDIFEDYEYNHSNYDDIVRLFEGDDDVTIHKEDAFEVYKKVPSSGVDMLHVDLSNDGDILKTIMEQWDDKMVQGGVILFEGGSQERDDGWIKEYNKKPIKEEMENNTVIRDKYVFGTYFDFPSLSVLLKKR